MTIETKFNVGDEVFYLEDNAIRCTPIKSIHIVAANQGNQPSIHYGMRWNPKLEIHETKVFATKEKLLDSL